MSLRASTSRAVSFAKTNQRYAQPSYAALSGCCSCSCKTPATRRFQSTTAAQNQAIEEHDIVIVGGGLVGLALANALSASKAVRAANYKISLLEGADLDKVASWNLPPDKWSNRISSITESSQAFLSKSGGWQRLDHSRTRPCEDMSVWDGLTGSRIEFSAWDVHTEAPGQPEMAKFVENLHLQKVLLDNMLALKQVECIDKTRVKEIVEGDAKEHGGWPIVHLENGRKIRARLLVGADGFNSPVKNYSGIQTTGWAYDAHCLVGTLEIATSAFEPNTTAWQRFLPVGPLGFLPIADNYASLAWSTKPEIAAALKTLDKKTLIAIINASFRLPWPSLSFLYHQLQHSPSTLLEDIAWRSSPENLPPHLVPREQADVPPVVLDVHMNTCASFPLKMSHAESYLGEPSPGGLPKRTVLIGDAAHTVHPMAGQGLNMGLGDAQALAETIDEAILEGADIGSKLALNPYPRKRYLMNHNIMSFIDKLHKLYAMETKPVVWARSTGVEILNELPSIKGAMMGTAGAGEGKAFGSRTNFWNGVATAAEYAEGARQIGGSLAGALRSRLAKAIAPRAA